jgi:heme-degrading monooxygenase HmoA
MEGMMYARVTQFRMQPSRVEEAKRITDHDIIPSIKNDPGFKHIFVLGDRTTGEGMVVSFWESEADLQATRAKIGQRFSQLGDIIIDLTQPSREFEVMSHG